MQTAYKIAAAVCMFLAFGSATGTDTVFGELLAAVLVCAAVLFVIAWEIRVSREGVKQEPLMKWTPPKNPRDSA